MTKRLYEVRTVLVAVRFVEKFVVKSSLLTMNWCDRSCRCARCPCLALWKYALGLIVRSGSGSKHKQVVYRPSADKLAIVQNGVLTKGTIPLPDGATAIYNASGLSYIRHKDWLGSSRLATTWAHANFSKEAYAPIG